MQKTVLKASGVIEDVVGEIPIMLERDEARLVRAIRKDSGENILKVRCFWFAWYAFHPETEVYGSEI